MAENETRVLSIRLPEELAQQIERDASGTETSASTIIRAIITQHYQRRDGETEAVRALGGELQALGEKLDERFWQLMYEHSRNRNSLFAIALAPVPDEQTLKAILKDSKESARQWVEQCRKSELRNDGGQPEGDGPKE